MIRPMQAIDVGPANLMVEANWGKPAAARCHLQIIEYFKGGIYAPQFFVEETSDGFEIAGFAGYVPSMIMPGVYESIWTVVGDKHQGKGVGSRLTRHRIAEIQTKGGKQIYHMTEKRKYFEGFGFEVAKTFGTWHLMVRELEPLEM